MNKRELINQSIDYIMQHLEENLTVEKVAAQFHFSKFYFSRMFKEETGESLYSFIKHCKVNQSAIDMKLEKERSITDIGLDYGYSSSNYSSVFKQLHMVSPLDYRKNLSEVSVQNPFKPEEIANFKSFEEYGGKIRVQKLEDYFVIYERFIGSYYEIEEKWRQFLLKYKDVQTEQSILMERYYDDPSIAAADQSICDLCMTVEEDCEFENVTWIQGGKWLIYHYEGSIQHIFETLQGVFTVFIPQSGYKMEKRYGLNIYKNIIWEQGWVSMDFCIPIQ